MAISTTTENFSPKQQTPNLPIAFSITNILSNNFGNAKKYPSDSNDEQVFCASEKLFSLRSNDDYSGSSAKKPKLDIHNFPNEQLRGELKYYRFTFAICLFEHNYFNQIRICGP